MRRLTAGMFGLYLIVVSSASAERKDVCNDAISPGGPTYGTVVEEFCAMHVFPASLEYNGVGVGRDNVDAERVERDGNSWWITVKARYSGRLFQQKIGADRVRVYYDNGDVRADLGGVRGALDTAALREWMSGQIDTWGRENVRDDNISGRVFDAAVEVPNNDLHFLADDKYYRFNVSSDRIDRTRPIGIPGWPGVWTDGVDAALLHPINHHVYLFKGSEFIKFDPRPKEQGGQKVVKQARINSDKSWIGVWHDLDAALVSPKVRDGDTYPCGYFFKGNRYQRFSFDKDEVEFEAEINSPGWDGIWTTGIDSALVHPLRAEGNRYPYAYFFRGNKYQRFNFDKEKRDKEGTIGASGWKGLLED